MRALVLIGAAALLLAGPAGADPPRSGVVHVKMPPGTPLVELGRALYGGNCSTCHGSRGEGIVNPPAGQGAGAQTAQGPSLRDAGALAADFYLRTGYMPLSSPGRQPWRSRVLFSDLEVRALVAYVASLGHGPPVPRPQPGRGSVSDGQRLFTEHCAGCHQVVAEGGYVTDARVPPLDRASDVQIAEAVRTGPYVMPVFTRSDIGDRQLDSIIAYVDYAKHPDDRGGWSLGHVGPIPEGIVTWLLAAALLVATCMVLGKRLKGGAE
jgi:ubiquinol-cytochrome c reductase cytochrome c subunit